jgi:hypothetical protein
MFFEDEAQCLVCGCTDMAACPEGCAWAVVSRPHGIGVCTTCDTPKARAGFAPAVAADALPEEPPPDLGACCACRQEGPTVRNIVMLDKRGLVLDCFAKPPWVEGRGCSPNFLHSPVHLWLLPPGCAAGQAPGCLPQAARCRAITCRSWAITPSPTQRSIPAVPR